MADWANWVNDSLLRRYPDLGWAHPNASAAIAGRLAQFGGGPLGVCLERPESVILMAQNSIEPINPSTSTFIF